MARSPDRIRLEGVACRCRVGVPDWERRRPQAVLLDVTLEADLRRAGASDDLADSPDYHGLERLLRKTAESGEFRLLERLAQALAEAALGFDRRIRSVTIAARKRPKVMPKTGAVAVEITRGRAKTARRPFVGRAPGRPTSKDRQGVTLKDSRSESFSVG